MIPYRKQEPFRTCLESSSGLDDKPSPQPIDFLQQPKHDPLQQKCEHYQSLMREHGFSSCIKICEHIIQGIDRATLSFKGTIQPKRKNTKVNLNAYIAMFILAISHWPLKSIDLVFKCVEGAHNPEVKESLTELLNHVGLHTVKMEDDAMIPESTSCLLKFFKTVVNRCPDSVKKFSLKIHNRQAIQQIIQRLHEFRLETLEFHYFEFSSRLTEACRLLNPKNLYRLKLTDLNKMVRNPEDSSSCLSILQKCPQIMELDVDQAFKAEEADRVLQIINSMPYLKMLNLWEYEHMRQTDVENLLVRNIFIEKINLKKYPEGLQKCRHIKLRQFSYFTMKRVIEAVHKSSLSEIRRDFVIDILKYMPKYVF